MGEEDKFHHKNNLPIAVMDTIKPIFKDLSDPTLLKRCLGGRTQNANDSFNSLVWRFCPKISGSSKIVADLAAKEAAIIFNEGRKGRLHIMRHFGWKVGQSAVTAACDFDRKRLQQAEKLAAEMTLENRRAKRMLNSSKLKQLSKSEGCVYEAGKF
jgi:hypothetical protein